jgi:hypothetical protein
MDRKAASARLRRTLARYRGGRFETSDSGGAGGMLFFIDADEKEWFIGGLHGDHGQALTSALNLVMELLQLSRLENPSRIACAHDVKTSVKPNARD